MKPSSINSTGSLIGGWYIDEKICDLIISDFEAREAVHERAHSVRGYTSVTSSAMNQALMSAYSELINRVTKEYTKLYTFSKDTIEAFDLAHPWNIQKYEVGRHYSAYHCENNGNPKFNRRHLAFMTYLNTVNDGGETEFLYQNLKIKPEKGLTLIWPAYFTHIHRGLPSNSEIKYVTTGWYEFFDTVNFLDSLNGVSDEDFFGKLDNLHRNVT